MKIDFVTKNRKGRSEKNIFFVEWLLFTGEDEIFRIEDKMKCSMMIEVVNDGCKSLNQMQIIR